MSSDAAYLLELFLHQLQCFQRAMYKKRRTPDKFERLSYGAWAIQETIQAINECEFYVTVGSIRGILRLQISEYDRYYSTDFDRYYNDNTPLPKRYEYAKNAVQFLYKLTEGYEYYE